jgi:cobalt-zinc-cadmium efflux system outer membrane protein
MENLYLSSTPRGCSSVSLIGLISVLLLVVPIVSLAQTVPPQQVNVEQAVQEAVDNDLNLLAERYNVAVADARIITARLRPNPIVSANANIVDHSLYHSGTSPFSEAVHIDLPFERGGKREYRTQVAENARGVAELQFLNSVRTLTLDVRNTAVDVLLAKANVALAQENLRAFNDIVTVNTNRVRAGDLAQVELERTRLAALQFQNDVQQSESNLRIARNTLQTLLGRRQRSPQFDVIGELRRQQQVVTIEGIREQAMRARPDLLALQRDQARSAADLRLQIAQGKVDYTVGAEIQPQQGNLRTGNQFGIFFSMPLPLFNRNQGEIERARDEQEQIATKIRALEADIENEVQNAYQQYSTAQALLQRIETEMLNPSRDVRETIEYSYRRGQSSFIEFLDAQRAFNDTRQSYNNAQADYARSLYLIDSVAGRVVTQ